MAPIEPGDDRWPSRKEQLLSDVYRRSQSLRRQRQLRIALAGAVAAVLIAAVPAVLAGDSGGRRALHTVGEPPTTTPETTPETVAAPDTTTTTETTTTTTVKPPATTTSLVCRNSYDARCGPFRWDPQPVNQPMTATVTYSPQNPKTGENVRFFAVFDDPDGPVGDYNTEWRFGDDHGGATMQIASCMATREKHGPWDPPPPTPGHREVGFENVYEKSGTYTATFSVYSPGGCGDPSPYASSGTATVTLTVTGPPVTTTTTTTTRPLTP